MKRRHLLASVFSSGQHFNGTLKKLQLKKVRAITPHTKLLTMHYACGKYQLVAIKGLSNHRL